MSVVEKLKKAIKNRPKALVPDYHADCRKMFQKVEESFRKIEVEFVALEKACVIVPRKKLEEKLGVCVGERAKGCRRLDHILIRELLEVEKTK